MNGRGPVYKKTDALQISKCKPSVFYITYKSFDAILYSIQEFLP